MKKVTEKATEATTKAEALKAKAEALKAKAEATIKKAEEAEELEEVMGLFDGEELTDNERNKVAKALLNEKKASNANAIQKQDKASIEAIINSVNAVVCQANSKLFNNCLPAVVVTVEKNKAKKNKDGYIETKSNWDIDNGKYTAYQLTLASDRLNRSAEEVSATVLTLLCELYCKIMGVGATRNGGTEYTKKFATIAQTHGLYVEKDAIDGYRFTSNTAFFAELKTLGLFEKLTEALHLCKIEAPTKPSKKKMHRYALGEETFTLKSKLPAEAVTAIQKATGLKVEYQAIEATEEEAEEAVA